MNTQHMEDKLLTVEEAAIAWAQGKKVEASMGAAWIPIAPVGKPDNRLFCYSGVFNHPDCCKYSFRLAPEPPAKKLRPYTREELITQLGRRIKTKTGGTFAILCSVLLDGNALVAGVPAAPDELLRAWEWVGGEPCGVEAGE